jgi:excisionase family DNA binding protein
LTDLLTTKQLQELLQVDRITIYRMLQDGRLSGFKVGGQWRFSRQEIEAWLEQRQRNRERGASAHLATGQVDSPLQVLPISCVDAIQGLCAEARGIAAVTVGLDGAPLTGISNSCDFCNRILATEKGRERCATAWKQQGPEEAHACHAGLVCINTPIHVGGQPIAIAASCQFAIQTHNGDWDRWQRELPQLAADLGLRVADLTPAANSLRRVSAEELSSVSQLLHRMAETLSELGQERLDLVSRLQHIAEVSKI